MKRARWLIAAVFVTALALAGCDKPTDGGKEETPPSPVTPPSTPAGLQVTADSSTNIIVTWTAVTGAASYRVYRSVSQTGAYEVVDDPAINGFFDTGLQPNTAYWYKVTALNAAGESGHSIAKSTTTLSEKYFALYVQSYALVNWIESHPSASYNMRKDHIYTYESIAETRTLPSIDAVISFAREKGLPESDVVEYIRPYLTDSGDYTAWISGSPYWVFVAERTQ
ncbi:hypothetical protein AGMMS49940_18150 [Spirochaetia bacterium]|nr:hypothetical protein AGMMS49940_18150 [Spirochaetia bacterium]